MQLLKFIEIREPIGENEVMFGNIIFTAQGAIEMSDALTAVMNGGNIDLNTIQNILMKYARLVADENVYRMQTLEPIVREDIKVFTQILGDGLAAFSINIASMASKVQYAVGSKEYSDYFNRLWCNAIYLYTRVKYMYENSDTSNFINPEKMEEWNERYNKSASSVNPEDVTKEVLQQQYEEDVRSGNPNAYEQHQKRMVENGLVSAEDAEHNVNTKNAFTSASGEHDNDYKWLKILEFDNIVKRFEKADWCDGHGIDMVIIKFNKICEYANLSAYIVDDNCNFGFIKKCESLHMSINEIMRSLSVTRRFEGVRYDGMDADNTFMSIMYNYRTNVKVHPFILGTEEVYGRTIIGWNDIRLAAEDALATSNSVAPEYIPAFIDLLRKLYINFLDKEDNYCKVYYDKLRDDKIAEDPNGITVIVQLVKDIEQDEHVFTIVANSFRTVTIAAFNTVMSFIKGDILDELGIEVLSHYTSLIPTKSINDLREELDNMDKADAEGLTDNSNNNIKDSENTTPTVNDGRITLTVQTLRDMYNKLEKVTTPNRRDIALAFHRVITGAVDDAGISIDESYFTVGGRDYHNLMLVIDRMLQTLSVSSNQILFDGANEDISVNYIPKELL